MYSRTLSHYNINLVFHQYNQLQEVKLKFPAHTSKNPNLNSISVDFHRFQEIKYENDEVLILGFANGDLHLDFPYFFVKDLHKKIKLQGGQYYE